MQEFAAAVVQDPEVKLLVLRSTSDDFPKSIACENITEDWRLEHLIPEAQENMMDVKLKFQGDAMSLRDLEALWPGVRGEVDGPLLSALVKAQSGDAMPALGPANPAFDDTCHLDRSLHHCALLRADVLTALDPARQLLALSGFTAEEVETLRQRDDSRQPLHHHSMTMGVNAERWLRLEDACGSAGEQELGAAFAQLCLAGDPRRLHWVARLPGRADCQGRGEPLLLWRATLGEEEALAQFVQPLAG
ncbi:Protein of unknown function, partial [Gryllus bimaculatus]